MRMKLARRYACYALLICILCIVTILLKKKYTAPTYHQDRQTQQRHQQSSQLTNSIIPNKTKTTHCELRSDHVIHLNSFLDKRMTNIVRPEIDDVSGHEETHVREFSFQPRYQSYPVNGTGITVKISEDFDTNIINSFCDSTYLKAVLPVYSAPDRFEHRRLLRESLGEVAISLDCRMFFIIGVSLDDGVNALLKEEYVREKDILMIDKIDTYRDLNNKAYAMIAWISKYCSHVPYTIHLVDDTYINLTWHLQKLDSIKGENFMLAPKVGMRDTVRIRQPRSFVTVEEYISNKFPVYAFGFAYAFRSSVASRLLAVAHSSVYCWIEDVWIGGHVREAAGLGLRTFSGWVAAKTYNQAPEKLPDTPVWHMVRIERLCKWYSTWLPNDGA